MAEPTLAPPYAPYRAARRLGECDGVLCRGVRNSIDARVPRALRRTYLLGLDRGLRAKLHMRRADVPAWLEEALVDLRTLPADVAFCGMTIGELVTDIERDIAELRELADLKQKWAALKRKSGASAH